MVVYLSKNRFSLDEAWEFAVACARFLNDTFSVQDVGWGYKVTNYVKGG